MPFEAHELHEFAALLPFCIGSAKHSSLLARAHPNAPHYSRPTGLVDEAGRIYEAQGDFIALLRRTFPGWQGGILPFTPPKMAGMERSSEFPLHVYSEFMADLILIRIWEQEVVDCLTAREREIAAKIAEGLRYKLVGKHFGISPSMVSNHVSRIYSKLKVSNRAGLVIALRG